MAAQSENGKLLTEVQELRRELQGFRNDLSSYLSEWKTWKQLRCSEHHERLEAIEAEQVSQDRRLVKASAKGAGIVAGIGFVITFIAGLVAYMDLTEKISRHVAAGG
jgi:hypothetical protein